MKTAVALTLISLAAAAAPAAGQDPRQAADAAVSAAVSRLDNHDREIAGLKSRVAALEAQPRATQPAAAAALPPDPRSRVLTYAELVACVEGGQDAVLYVGVSGARGGTYVIQGYVASLTGTPPGVYACFEEYGVAKFKPVAATQSTPAFATPIRDAIYTLAAPSGCANGQCPTPARSRR